MAVRYGLEQDASGVPYLVAEGAVGEDEILLDSPTAVKHFLNSDYIRLGHQAEEHVWMLTTDARKRVKGVFELAHGTINLAPLSPRMVLSRALLMGSSAESVIVAHNHPSGDVTPSDQDRAVARRIREAGKLVDVDLIDFVIIGGNDIYSFDDHGDLDD